MYGSFNDFFKLEVTGAISGEALLGVNNDIVDDLVEADEAKEFFFQLGLLSVCGQ